MPPAVAGPEIERLIQLLARLPGLGPRSARRAALFLIKKREQIMAPLAAALADRDREDRGLQRVRQYRHPEPLHGLHRPAARSRHHRGGDGRGRPVGARARARHQCALPCARRHALAARRCRPAGSLDRCADHPRARCRRHRGDPRPQRHRRRPDHRALHHRPAAWRQRQGHQAGARRAGRRASSIISTRARCRRRSASARRSDAGPLGCFTPPAYAPASRSGRAAADRRAAESPGSRRTCR